MTGTNHRSKLPLGQRVVVRALDLYIRAAYRVIAPFNEDYVRTFGAWEYVKWMLEAERIRALLERRYGKTETQMLISMAGLLSGCRWCSIQHMLLANLMIFEQTGELGPVDELDLPRWQEMRDAEVLEVLEESLQPRWSHIVPVLRRLYELRAGLAEPSTDDDYLLVRTNVMWEWAIECTITALDFDPASIPPFGPMARDRTLFTRYRNARAEHRSGPTPD